jgi:hypothetical protein
MMDRTRSRGLMQMPSKRHPATKKAIRVQVATTPKVNRKEARVALKGSLLTKVGMTPILALPRLPVNRKAVKSIFQRSLSRRRSKRNSSARRLR